MQVGHISNWLLAVISLVRCRVGMPNICVAQQPLLLAGPDPSHASPRAAQAFVGHVGRAELAAATLAQTLYNLICKVLMAGL